MYNIRSLLLMLSLLSIGQSVAQLPGLVGEEVNLSAALANRQASFTVHLLTGKVDNEKEHAYGV